MPIISSSNCNGSRSGGGVNMTGSPFYFSSYRNTFISVGCDDMATMTGIDPMVVIGCKSDCNNGSLRHNRCSGFKCCQTAVPDGIQYLEYVPVVLEWTATNEARDPEFILEMDELRCSLLLLRSWIPRKSLSSHGM
uniref:Wall-associated receptor kinase domain-containing protein n=1 Tax=Fagus sylvatica TaxID=28930 RepID=A0A2N9HBN1_FAGSY